MIKIKEQEHKVWKEMTQLEITPMIGKTHYIYKNEKGKISLVFVIKYDS